MILAHYPIIASIRPFCKKPNHSTFISNELTELSSTKPVKWVFTQHCSSKRSRFSKFLMLRFLIYNQCATGSKILTEPEPDRIWIILARTGPEPDRITSQKILTGFDRICRIGVLANSILLSLVFNAGTVKEYTVT